VFVQLNKLNGANHCHEPSDLQPQLAMQRKKSLERLHDNGDVPHSWSEDVSE